MHDVSMMTRRQFSRLALAASPLILAAKNARASRVFEASPAQNISSDYDVLIKGGTVIDPSQKLHAALDVAVKDGKVVEIAKNLPMGRARKIFPADGRIVTPGLINIHEHVYDGIGTSVNADRCCLSKGVTTIVDAGSAGHLTIEDFQKHIINTSVSRIYALLDIEAIGLAAGIKILDSHGELQNLDPARTAEAARRHKPFVIGIKVRLGQNVEGTRDLEALQRAREAAAAADIPLMAHIGDPYSPLKDILKLMRKGDIITHCFNDQPHGILDAQGKVLPEVLEARQRGVLFDVGAGGTHLGFRVAEKCLKQDFLPDTISSEAACCDLTTTLSRFLALGMSVEKVIELATLRPAQVFQFREKLGTLRPGSEADIAILQVVEGKIEFSDSVGEKRAGHQNVVCAGTLRSGTLVFWNLPDYIGVARG